MATLPPWLQPVDLVGAASRGAQLGLSIRAQDQAAEERAAQLALEGDRINIAQQAHAMQWEQANQRAAEALRSHNALEVFRQQNLSERQRQNAILQADRDAAAALRREEFEYRKKSDEAKRNVKPEVSTVTDPLTGEERSVMQTGPNTFRMMPVPKPGIEQKALSAIEERDLVDTQRQLMKDRQDAITEKNKKELARIESELLKNKTAQSNLVLSAAAALKPRKEEPWDKYAPGKLTPPAEAASPSQMTFSQATGGVPDVPGTPSIFHISTKDEYDALPSGATYINDKTGLKSRKP